MPEFYPENIPAKKWYQTAGGIIFLVFFSLVILTILGFTVLFGYYVWQVKFGDAGSQEKLATQFSQDLFLSQSSANKNDAVKDITLEQMTKYIHPANPTFGNSKAKVKILMFVDFECPYCQTAYSDFKKVMEKYEPVVQVIFKNLPLTDIHTNAVQSASSGLCANEQKKFWQYYGLLFTRQLLDDASLLNYAKELGLDEKKFALCLQAQKYDKAITADLADAVELGLRGTPTYFVNGQAVEGVKNMAEWDKIILPFLK